MATDSRWWEEYECAMDAHPSSREEAQEIVRAAAKVAGGKHSFLQLAGSVLAYAVQVAGVPQQSRIVCPVAILTDAQTASSGEATLICFRGLDYVRVFGAPTAGYASANQPFPLPGGDRLVLTTGCDVSRTGEVFCDDPINPDVYSETPLEDALAWITGD